MRRKPPSLSAFSAKDIAAICHVDLATARRWRRQAVCPPWTALALLGRDLGCFSAHWRGWTIHGETLTSPEGWSTTRGEAMSVQILHQQIAILKAELRRTTETLALEEQPAPPEALPDIVG
jgi:hypothetical protein